jgi:hypothetical protein
MPATPRHSRHTSAAEFDSTPSAQERRQSKSSLHEPLTPLRGGFNQQDVSGFGTGGGLGNLADELADAFSDGEDDEYYEQEGEASDSGSDARQGAADKTRDSGVDVESAGSRPEKKMSLSLPSPNGRGHRRTPSEYDGSEYGSESDLDSPSMPASLVAKLDAVESLARRGSENNGGPGDGAFKRVTDGLRDLGSQSGVEGGATR